MAFVLLWKNRLPDYSPPVSHYFCKKLFRLAICYLLTTSAVVAADDTNTVATPAIIQPSWNQLMNGSLDSEQIEVRGIIEGISNRKDGWSVVNLRTHDGVLKVIVRRGKIKGATLAQSIHAVIRVRGKLSVDRDPANQRVISGQVRFPDSEIIVDEPAPADLFAIPLTTAMSLTHSDSNYNAFRLVKVAGQIIQVRSRLHFLMDAGQGLRFVTDQPSGLLAGDTVEVVGYPDSLKTGVALSA